MKLQLLVLALVALVIVECGHTFLGTNVRRPLIFQKEAKYSSKLFQKRVENIRITVPSVPAMMGRAIQGILAYDKTHTSASANVTEGGIGYNFVNIRMKSERGEKLNYDIYVYA